MYVVTPRHQNEKSYLAEQHTTAKNRTTKHHPILVLDVKNLSIPRIDNKANSGSPHQAPRPGWTSHPRGTPLTHKLQAKQSMHLKQRQEVRVWQRVEHDRQRNGTTKVAGGTNSDIYLSTPVALAPPVYVHVGAHASISQKLRRLQQQQQQKLIPADCRKHAAVLQDYCMSSYSDGEPAAVTL
jgi:hypothetical protein